MIEVKNLRKTFKVARRSSGMLATVKSFVNPQWEEVVALDDITFSIEPGEIVGYMGPNGAGKSTTIKTMSGIMVPDSGKCMINGLTPWKSRHEHVGRIGVVFGQRTQLWWDTPVIDSMELLKSIYKVPHATYVKNLKKLTEALNLEQLLRTPVRQLSLGQRMRCEVAASLLHDPDILFLDEPTIGLDAVSKLAIRDFIQEMNRERGVTVILTTHDTSDIDALCDRVLLIGKGRILYDDGFATLKSQFSPERFLTVTGNFSKLNHYSHEALSALLPKVDILSKSHERWELKVDSREVDLSGVISVLSQEVELQDLEISALPVDEIIARLYQAHNL